MVFSDLFTDPAYLLYGITMCLFLPFLLFGIIASVKVQTVFGQYNRIESSSGISAQGYVRKFLDSEGLKDIKSPQYADRSPIISIRRTIRYRFRIRSVILRL